MDLFVVGHATHPDWRMALTLAAASIPPASETPTLGFVYFTDHHAAHAEGMLAELRRRWPDTAWVGCVGVGVIAGGVEYFDEPAVVLMLSALPRTHFELFSGARPLQRADAFSALVHADGSTPDLGDVLHELSERLRSGYLFGGLAASRTSVRHIADGVWQGGLSGVAFTDAVPLLSRVTQGCLPIGPVRRVTVARANQVIELDGEAALPCLLRDLGIGAGPPRQLVERLRQTLVGLSDPGDEALGRGGQFGTDTRVRHVIGIDPGHETVAVADIVEPGMRLAFCRRDAAAARRDLVRICSEIREELSEALPDPAPALPGRPPAATEAPQTQRRIAGAIYVSCAGRGGPHFGAPSAEAQIVRHALGDVPLVGLFAGGEIARHHLYGYTGVLTVFVER